MEFLILYRIHVVLSLILEKLNHFLKDPEFPDVDDAATLQEFDAKYPLTNGWIVYVRERYRSTDYELHVDYVYLLVDSTGNPIFSCDNAPHHPQVRSFPNHKHRYPKDLFKPTAFSGQIEDFLEDVLWELSRTGGTGG